MPHFRRSSIFNFAYFLTTFIVLGSVATGVKERHLTAGAVAGQDTVDSAAERNEVGSVAEPNTVAEVRLVPEEQGLSCENATV